MAAYGVNKFGKQYSSQCAYGALAPWAQSETSMDYIREHITRTEACGSPR